MFLQSPAENLLSVLRLEKFYSVGLVWQDLLLGNMTFALQKGTPLKTASLIETYARAASIALQRQIAEDAFKESERKRAEEALKNSENYLLTIFNATQSGLVVIDPETRILSMMPIPPQSHLLEQRKVLLSVRPAQNDLCRQKTIVPGDGSRTASYPF